MSIASTLHRVAIAGAALLFCAASAAAETPATKVVTLPPAEAAKLAISVGQFAVAENILGEMLQQDPSSPDALFLMGEAESRQKKFAAAIAYYRRILVDHPDLVRVRLDLARALFETHDDDSAEYNFHLALAQGDLPDTVIDNVERYLAVIRSRKHFVYDLHVGIAPDTNINQAAATDHVTLFGLPFALSQQARQQSGIGIDANIGGEYRWDLQPDLRLRSGANVYWLAYPSNRSFDDLQLRATVGPQWLFARGDISVLGVVAKRWYGNDPYNVGAGGRIEGQYWLTKQFLWSSYVEGLSDTYHSQTFLNGFYIDQGNFLDYYVSPSSFVRGTVGVGYQKAESDVFSNWYYRLGIAYQQEFAWGITANLAPEVRWWQYQATDPLFLSRRSDRQYFVKLSLYKRNFTIFGFAPVVSYSYATNQSNQALFKYNRNQFELGFTRQF
jgi:tetratricopeptide (TPR) repeat protein